MPGPRLRAWMADAASLELTLICAPAGFGKTTMLVDWAQHAGTPERWSALDVGDNDSARFWRYVASTWFCASKRWLPSRVERAV
jgi:LuxR family transcriptional regulator, maltose regulon positive regulatory protein